MPRKIPANEELFALLLLQHLNLIEKIPLAEIKWDKPDIQLGDKLGIEVVQMVSPEEKRRDAFGRNCLFGKGYSGIEAREVVAKESKNKEDRAAFLDFNGSHYINPCLTFASTTGGGGFNLTPRIEKLKSLLNTKIIKWEGYAETLEKRCFVFSGEGLGEGFFGIENTESLEEAFRDIYKPDSFNVLYFFGDFHNLEFSSDRYAVIKLTAIQDKEIRIITQIHSLSKKDRIELQMQSRELLKKWV